MQEKNLIKKLESNRPSLSTEESLRIWKNVEAKLPVLSPAMSTFSAKTVSPLILILILALSGGATAFASDSSKPGDFLFPLERTIENAQLSLAFTDEEKALLTKTFTEERIKELREIIDEEISVSPSNNDITLNSSAKDKEVATISNNGEVRINTAVEALLIFLDQTNTDEINRQDLLSLLSTEVESVTEPVKVKREKDSMRIGNENSRVEIRVNDDGDSRIEIRQGENHVRIEEKSGEVKVKKSKKNSDEDSDSNKNEGNLKEEDNDRDDDHVGDRKDKDRDQEDRDNED